MQLGNIGIVTTIDSRLCEITGIRRIDLLHNPRITENYPHMLTMAFLGIA